MTSLRLDVSRGRLMMRNGLIFRTPNLSEVNCCSRNPRIIYSRRSRSLSTSKNFQQHRYCHNKPSSDNVTDEPLKHTENDKHNIGSDLSIVRNDSAYAALFHTLKIEQTKRILINSFADIPRFWRKGANTDSPNAVKLVESKEHPCDKTPITNEESASFIQDRYKNETTKIATELLQKNERDREHHDLESALLTNFETVQIYCSTTGTGDGKTTDGLLRNIKNTKATQTQNGSYMDVMTGDKLPPKSSPGAEKNSDQQLGDQSFEAEIASVVQELEGKDNPPQQTTAQKIFNRMPNLMPSRKEKPKKVETPAATPAAEPTSSEVIVRPTITRRLHHRTRTPTAQHEKRTRELAVSLILATGAMSKSSRLEALCEQLAEYPRTRGIALEENVVPVMLSMRNSSNIYTHRQANLGLSLVGYVDPVKGRGINILSLDGGGTRGFYTLELLKQLENYTGKRVIDNFDLICGVSAGALIATLLCSSNLSIRECETRFREFSKKMFTQGRVPGISKLVLTHSYYDTKLWEEVLKANVDQASFLDTAKILSCPKFVTVSTIMNAEKMEHFLFRNYEYPVGRSSRYPGSMNYKMWEAVRASSAAPGYYEDYKLGEHIHVDGGVLSNNPTAIALHEANVLWPREEIQCIVSIGTGRFEPAATGYKDIQSIPLKDKLLKIVQSATNTEGVHTTLHDLMPPQSYFRFNPYMSEDFQLDEIREASWEKMYMDAKLYSDKNHHKFHACAKKLLLRKTAKQAVQEKFRFASDRYYSSVFGKPRRSSSRY